MQVAELAEILHQGEDSRHQFKVNITNADSLASEMVAFSNCLGGKIFVGVRDDGTVQGLTSEDIRRLNLLVSNSASQHMNPVINPLTEIVTHPDGKVLIISVEEGINKPYMDRGGVVWVKSGADKRRATSREELQRLFAQAGLVHADEMPVKGMGVDQLDLPYFEAFFERRYGVPLPQELSLEQVLSNLNLTRNGCLNYAGALLFGKNPQYQLPTCIVKAVAFVGTEIEGQQYIDSRDIGGKLSDIFLQTISFLLNNIRAVQGNQSFNSLGQPEIPRIVLEELVANALIHRDYLISAPVRVLIFADRIEIISPGHLPNHLTVENIKAGNSNMRNPILASFAGATLPYRGLGSGILRVLKEWPQTEFIDDRNGNLFKVIIRRPVIVI